MSCGGPQLPIMTQLRIQAANIAATAVAGSPVGVHGATFNGIAEAALAFITKDLDLAALESASKKAVSAADRGPKARIEFLASPAKDLSCEYSGHERLSPLTVRGMINWPERFQALGPVAYQCIAAELARHGLRFGMTDIELTMWIANGQQPEEAPGA